MINSNVFCHLTTLDEIKSTSLSENGKCNQQPEESGEVIIGKMNLEFKTKVIKETLYRTQYNIGE